MNRFYSVIGGTIFWLSVAGTLGLIDVHLCIGPTGKCIAVPKIAPLTV